MASTVKNIAFRKFQLHSSSNSLSYQDSNLMSSTSEYIGEIIDRCLKFADTEISENIVISSLGFQS